MASTMMKSALGSRTGFTGRAAQAPARQVCITSTISSTIRLELPAQLGPLVRPPSAQFLSLSTMMDAVQHQAQQSAGELLPTWGCSCKIRLLAMMQVAVGGMKEVRDRIASVKNTQKITEAMKLVAAAKVRRAQEAVVNARPFSENLVKVSL